MVELSDRLGGSVVVAVPSNVASFPHRDLQENIKPKQKLPLYIYIYIYLFIYLFILRFPLLPPRARKLSRTDSRQSPG